MSRMSPTGFLLSIVLEVAAVVFIVSFLPRMNISSAGGERAATAADTGFGKLPELPAPPAARERPTWLARPDQASAAPRETSYYERRAELPSAAPVRSDLPQWRQPPALIAVDPARPGYVEQRLDQASQGLVNSVGSYVAQAADDLLRNPPPAGQPRAAYGQPAPAYVPAISVPLPASPLAASPPPAVPPPPPGSFSAPPRAWRSY